MSQSGNADSSETLSELSTQLGHVFAQEKPVTKPSTSFPSRVTEKILWSPPFPDPTSTSGLPNEQPRSGNASAIPISPPIFTFPDGILSEVQAATSYAFSRAVQRASVDVAHCSFSDNNENQIAKSLVEPIISLCYPHDGCNDIIDSVVKSLAREQQADVVVLDSLELALEEFGAFGKEVAHAINTPYTVPSTSHNDIEKDYSDYHANSHDTEAHMIQKVFNDIVDIRREPNTSQGNSGTLEQTKSRIIYMRDFGRIAPSAALLVPYLLQALRTRRVPIPDSPDCERELQPTVLILGFTETNAQPKYDYDEVYVYGMCRNNREVDTKHVPLEFAKGGAALGHILPSLDNKRFTLRNETLPSLLSPLSTTFFLTSLADPRELRTTTPKSDLTSNSTLLDDLTSIGTSLSVFPKESISDGFRQVEQRMEWRRRQEIQNAWMAIYLGRRGAELASENLLESIQDRDIPTTGSTAAAGDEYTCTPLPPDIPKVVALLDGLCKHTGIPLPVALDRIVTIALGLSLSQSSGSEAAVQVTATAISRGYQLFIENWKTRSDWLDMINKHQEEVEKKDSEEEKVLDPIVKKVQESNDLSSYETKLIGCIVDGGKLVTTFEDVCISGKIVDSLRTIISLPLLHPTAFKIGILGREAIGGVLLYGPPGTGKTLVCRALARECGTRMLQVKPSDIMDCYVGESEKLVKAIFTLAYRLAPCVIFIDEMDALFRARTGKDDRQYYRNILNEFLQSMDGLQSAKKNKDAGVVVVGATNRPYDLDDAVLRRLPTRMMVDLPSENEREQILHLHLRDEKLNGDVNLGNIAQRTHYYSGSDLKNLCVSAAMESVKGTVGDFSWTPKTLPNSSAGTSDQNEAPVMTGADGAESKIQTRTITQAHFTHAIGEVSASSSVDSHAELYRWHVQFGRKRARG